MVNRFIGYVVFVMCFFFLPVIVLLELFNDEKPMAEHFGYYEGDKK